MCIFSRYSTTFAAAMEYQLDIHKDKAFYVSQRKDFTLIKAAPGYGSARTRQLMHQLHISESRRIKGLGANQHAALVETFGGER